MLAKVKQTCFFTYRVVSEGDVVGDVISIRLEHVDLGLVCKPEVVHHLGRGLHLDDRPCPAVTDGDTLEVDLALTRGDLVVQVCTKRGDIMSWKQKQCQPYHTAHTARLYQHSSRQ